MLINNKITIQFTTIKSESQVFGELFYGVVIWVIEDIVFTTYWRFILFLKYSPSRFNFIVS